MDQIQPIQVIFTVALGLMLVFGAGLIFKARQRGRAMTTTERIKQARMEQMAKGKNQCA
jgi:hypothetical protein